MEYTMIHLNNVNLGYQHDTILKNISLDISKGEFVGIIGLSGAGKSTLLTSMIANVTISGGSFHVLGNNIATISSKELRAMRSRIGFIFQGYNLVNRLSVLHNVMSGMLKSISIHRAAIRQYSSAELEKAWEYMETVGIDQIAMKRCDELTGGQRQRVAIARALAQEAEILLADEPIAALDPKSAVQVMDILWRINEKYQVTIVSNLHHIDFAKSYCSRIVGVADQTIIFDGTTQQLNEKTLERIYQTTKNNPPLSQEDPTPEIWNNVTGKHYLEFNQLYPTPEVTA